MPPGTAQLRDHPEFEAILAEGRERRRNPGRPIPREVTESGGTLINTPPRLL